MNRGMEEQEIDLLQLMLFIFKRWRFWGIVCLICVVLVGGGMFAAKTLPKISAAKAAAQINAAGGDTETEEAFRPDTQLIYDATIASMQSQIKGYEKAIQDEETYQKASILARLDPNRIETKTISYYVDSHYMVDPNLSIAASDPAQAVLNAYVKAVTGQIDMKNWEDLAKKYGSEPQYLTELVQISSDDYGKTFSIAVVSAENEMVNDILKLYLETVPKLKKQVKQTVAEHDLLPLFDEATLLKASGKANSRISQTQGWTAQKVLDYQKAHMDNLTAYQKALTDVQTRLVQLDKTYADAAKNAKSAANNAVATFSAKQAAKDMLKYAVIGFFVGILLSGMWLTGQFLAAPVLYTDEVFGRNGIEMMAVLREKGKTVLDRFLINLETRGSVFDTEETLCAYAAAAISAKLQKTDAESEEQQIALVSTLKSDTVEALQTGINAALKKRGTEGITVISAGNILNAPEALDKLMKCQQVLLLEKKSVSVTKDVSEECRILRDLNRKPMGAVRL